MRQAAGLSLPRRLSARLAALLCLLLLLGSVLAGLAELILPEAPGDIVFEKKGTIVDASHANLGYVMVRQEGQDKKLKLRLSRGKYTLTYDLNNAGDFEVYPLQLGEGKYKLEVFAQVSGKRYSPVSSLTFSVDLQSELAPFLCPNQYVSYTADSLVVRIAGELCAGLNGDREKCDAIRQYVVSRMTYDTQLAQTVEAGYLPAPDQTLKNNSGICFDFSSLLAAMLRSQGIAAQLVIGYADKQYHAWNEAYLDGEWRRIDATSDICGVSVRKYAVERYY